ncbi:MAG TPA: hypothetical protein ENG95_02970 [Nitrospirae bacterium]|nr:hypothetical protein BMS3Bbin08_00264 [bacterium BMS3Bbin08]HDH50056.1 hypothetical protein [Nitrospirota bacterium]HDK16913.1 hypothetical protein [Nitrospirota bacterium]HDO25593.1 hypothetical protein [Nitrospirota bacterium]HDZ83644.1 hypothetical protein [Nitrospirota bacterium]
MEVQKKFLYCFVLMVISLCGCAAWQHGWTTDFYQEQLMSTKSSHGAKRLKIEMDYDATIQHHVTEHGPPDYIYVVSGNKVIFTYIKLDEIVLFKRSILSSNSKVSTRRHIPDNLMNYPAASCEVSSLSFRLVRNLPVSKIDSGQAGMTKMTKTIETPKQASRNSFD